MEWRRKRRPFGAWIVVAVVVSLFVYTASGWRRPRPVWEDRARALDRQRIVATLEAMPGKHLVMVRYARDRRAPWEMVYNAATIDKAKVVWARELGPERNRELFGHYPKRKVWLVIAADPVPLALRGYVPEAAEVGADGPG